MRRARGLNQPGGAVEGLAVDRHELDVALDRLDQVAVGLPTPVGRDEHVAVETLLQPAEASGPAERVGGVAGGHRAQLLGRELPAEVRPVPHVGHLQLAEQFLGAGWRPVGAEAQAHALVSGRTTAVVSR